MTCVGKLATSFLLKTKNKTADCASQKIQEINKKNIALKFASFDDLILKIRFTYSQHLI